MAGLHSRVRYATTHISEKNIFFSCIVLFLTTQVSFDMVAMRVRYAATRVSEKIIVFSYTGLFLTTQVFFDIFVARGLKSRVRYDMGWLRLVGSLKTWVSFDKELCKRDYILQKRHTLSRSLRIKATS